MQRIVALVSIVALTLVGMLATNLWPNVAAQNTPTDATAGHPVVGAWWWENISSDPFDDSYGVFHADGTYVEETAYIGTGIGVWQATGERTAELLLIFQDIEGGLDPTKPAAFAAGTVTFRLSIELDESGNALVSEGPTEIRSPDGTVTDEFPYQGTANRITIGWVMPIAAATPTT